jgi:NADH-quinone oxidoreductase subunit K
MIGFSHYLILSTILFTIGVAGVLLRRNIIVMLMSIELMLNASNLVLVAISKYAKLPDSQIFVFFVITVAAAEAAVGLAIVIAYFRHKQTTNIDDINLMRG